MKYIGCNLWWVLRQAFRRAQGRLRTISPRISILAGGLEQEKGTIDLSISTLFASKWLPEAGATLTLSPKLTIPFKPLLFHGNKEKGVPVKTRKRDDILKLLAKAEAYESTIAQKGLTKAQLSRKQGTSRARMTQIMNLLKLTPEIRDYIKNLKDPDQIKFFTERKLRKIASIKGNQVQLKNFEELKRKAVI